MSDFHEIAYLSWYEAALAARKERDRLATENAAIKAENALLRKALEPFAAYADKRVMPFPDDMKITNGSSLAKRQLTMGDCRAARSALGESK